MRKVFYTALVAAAIGIPIGSHAKSIIANADSISPIDTFSHAIHACENENSAGMKPVDVLVRYNACMLDAVRNYGPEALSDDEQLYYEMAGTHLLSRSKQVQRGEISIEEYNRDDQETRNTLAKWEARDAAQERQKEVANAKRQDASRWRKQQGTESSVGICDIPSPACNAAMAIAMQPTPQYHASEYHPVPMPEQHWSDPVVPVTPMHLKPAAHETWPTPPALPQTYMVNQWRNGETVTGPQGEVARCQNWQNSIQCAGN